MYLVKWRRPSVYQNSSKTRWGTIRLWEGESSWMSHMKEADVKNKALWEQWQLHDQCDTIVETKHCSIDGSKWPERKVKVMQEWKGRDMGMKGLSREQRQTSHSTCKHHTPWVQRNQRRKQTLHRRKQSRNTTQKKVEQENQTETSTGRHEGRSSLVIIIMTFGSGQLLLYNPSIVIWSKEVRPGLVT